MNSAKAIEACRRVACTDPATVGDGSLFDFVVWAQELCREVIKAAPGRKPRRRGDCGRIGISIGGDDHRYRLELDADDAKRVRDWIEEHLQDGRVVHGKWPHYP